MKPTAFLASTRLATALALGASAQQPALVYVSLASLGRPAVATATATATATVPPASSSTRTATAVPSATPASSTATATSTAASGSATPTRTATASPTATFGPGCHPSYPDFCIPPPPPDLNCADVAKLPGYRAGFRVIHTVPDPDPHRLDGDKDGDACEAG